MLSLSALNSHCNRIKNDGLNFADFTFLTLPCVSIQNPTQRHCIRLQIGIFHTPPPLRGFHVNIRDLKHADVFNMTWPPFPSIDKCCQVASLSIERTDHHILLKALDTLSMTMPSTQHGCQFFHLTSVAR